DHPTPWRPPLMQLTSPESAATDPGKSPDGAGHRVRTLGNGRTLLVGALGTVVGLGAGVSTGIVSAADVPAPTTPVVTADAAGDNGTIIDVVKSVAPAVVTINVTSTASDTQLPFGGNGPQGFVQQGTGSGVIIHPNRLILT